jgi:phosphate/sulfate permease
LINDLPNAPEHARAIQSSVRWGLAGSIVWAWILTIPASGLMAAAAWWIGKQVLKN